MKTKKYDFNHSVKKTESKIDSLKKKLAFFSKSKKTYERQANDDYWLK